jgi:hypothetical protein
MNDEEMVQLFERRFSPPASHTISVYRKPDDQSPRNPESTRGKGGGRPGRPDLKLRYLGKFDMEFVDELFIQQQFGGGVYVLKLLDSRGRWLRQHTVHIA